MDNISVNKTWQYQHLRGVDAISIADQTGDMLIIDRRECVILLDKNGKEIFSKKVNFSPVNCAITADGQYIFLLTFAGHLMKISRDTDIEWDIWVDKSAEKLAVKNGGQSAVVASRLGRFHLVNSSGEKVRLVHTPEPVIHLRFSANGKRLVVTSAHGWIGMYDGRVNPMGEFEIGRPVGEVELCDGGNSIVIPSRDQGLTLVRLDTEELTGLYPGFDVSSAGVDRSGERVIVAGLCGSLALMNLAGDVGWKRKFDESWAMSEMFADGERFVCVSDKGKISNFAINRGAERALQAAEVSEGDNKVSQFDFIEV
jgi:hypothetical protein